MTRLVYNDDSALAIPKDALRMCAFFRVWCLVELAEALREEKPVVSPPARRSHACTQHRQAHVRTHAHDTRRTHAPAHAHTQS